MSQETQEILAILRALTEQSLLHDKQIAQNTANIQILTQVVAEQGEYFRSVAQNVERITETVENVVAEMRVMQGEMRVMQGEMRIMQGEMRVMQGEIQTMQSEIKGLQTENRRILDILQRRDE